MASGSRIIQVWPVQEIRLHLEYATEMLATQTPKDSRHLGDLPGESARTRIEVFSRTAEDGSPLLELVEYSWGSGLGWYVQKRLTLDAAQVEALRALLGDVVTTPQKPVLNRPLAIREDNVIQLVFPA